MLRNRRFIQEINNPVPRLKPVVQTREFENISCDINIFFVKRLKYFLFIIPIILVSIVLLIFRPQKNPKQIPEKVIAAAPETALQKYQRTLISVPYINFRQQLGEDFNTSNQPEVSGKSGVMIDLHDGKKVFDLESNKRMPIASLVKVMTAVVALEHMDVNATITISEAAANTGENAMGLTVGEKYSLKELLYGLILNSGNDAAVAIAEGVAGDKKTFVEWMNVKAKELGLVNTYFADPSGLDDSSYSSALDLIKLAAYAMQNPVFQETAATSKKFINSTDDHKYLELDNQTNLLTTYPGVRGVKTGYTEEAGLCLITYAENDDKRLLGVILNSVDRKGDMILMLDHGFSTLGLKVVHHLLD